MRKRLFMYVNLLLLGIVCLRMQHQSTHEIFQTSILDKNEWIQLMEGKEEKILPYQLYLEGEKLPVYTSKLGEGYMISLSDDQEGLKNKITVSEGYEIVFLESDALWDIKTAVKNMSPLSFLIYNETGYCRGNLYCTSLPIMVLDTETVEYDNDGEELCYGEMTLYGGRKAGNKAGNKAVVTSRCEFHIRGVSSRVYYKMSYKLNLLDEGEDKNQMSLLGMRKDDDWILRSLAVDESKIREKLATDLWNKMNSFGSYHMEYIELFLDGEYWGLYALQEPLDFKTIQCSEEDTLLYKIRCWPDEASFLDDMEKYGRENLVCGDIEINKAHENNLAAAYDVMEEYKYFLKGESACKIQLELDKENLYKLNIFLSAIIGTDNTGKNQYLIANRIEDSKYRIRKLPWDFDMTWGLYLDDKVHEDFFDTYVEDETIRYLMTVEPDETKAGICNMYHIYSKTVLSEDYLLSQVDKQFGTINESGALMRENEAWGQNCGEEHAEQLKRIIQRRLIWMEEYYTSL